MTWQPPAIGTRATWTRTFSADDVDAFATLSGDRNPLHFDPEFAARTSFGRLVVHGGLTAGLFNALVAERLPGLLPALGEAESMEVTAIHSVLGALGPGQDARLITRPPFVAPHHGASQAAVIGGGSGHYPAFCGTVAPCVMHLTA